MRKVLAGCVVLSLVACSGCMSVAKRGIAEVRGASSDVYPLKTLSPGTAKAASSHKIGTIVADGMGAPEFRNALATAFQKKYAELKKDGKIKPGSGGTLTIKPTVRFYAGKGAGKLVGGMAFAVVRVEVTDQSGNVVGKADALCSTKALRTSGEDLAQSVAEKILEWVATGKT